MLRIIDQSKCCVAWYLFISHLVRPHLQHSFKMIIHIEHVMHPIALKQTICPWKSPSWWIRLSSRPLNNITMLNQQHLAEDCSSSYDASRDTRTTWCQYSSFAWLLSESDHEFREENVKNWSKGNFPCIHVSSFRVLRSSSDHSFRFLSRASYNKSFRLLNKCVNRCWTRSNNALSLLYSGGFTLMNNTLNEA